MTTQHFLKTANGNAKTGIDKTEECKLTASRLEYGIRDPERDAGAYEDSYLKDATGGGLAWYMYALSAVAWKTNEWTTLDNTQALLTRKDALIQTNETVGEFLDKQAAVKERVNALTPDQRARVFQE